jgi:hypothetical protein
MNKHKVQVKEMIERNGELSRDLFFSEQNIHNMAGKLAKEMYKKHENDAQSVHMWVAENKDNIFFNHKTNVEVDYGGYQSRNMLFTIGIQIEWQQYMILQHDHESGVFIDTTFETNE